VDQAMRLWSDGITHYTPTDADQYGAFRVGPSYPLTFARNIPMQAYPYAMFGGGICNTFYTDSITADRYSFVSLRTPEELASLKKMKQLVDEGLAILEKIENPNEKLERLINLGKFISNSLVTGIHAKEAYQIKCEMMVTRTRERLHELLNAYEDIIKAEIANAEATIPLVEVDSRLGWEPSMEYMTDKEHLLWKIRAEEYVLNSEIVKIRRSIDV